MHNTGRCALRHATVRNGVCKQGGSELPTLTDSRLTFWTELGESTGKWVHALPVGTWQHPIHGKVNHTPDRIQRFADNVNQKVRGIDLYVNYDHREHGGEAAGWIKQAEARDDGLWVFVEWTEDAAKKLKNKEYRYWSTEYSDEWEDPHTGQKHNDVLFGGALTNVPFLKNLVPVNLSEFGHKADGGNEVMDREKIIKLLGLADGATDEQIEAKLNELTELSEGEQLEIDFSKLSFTQEGNTVKVTHPDAEGEATFEVKAPAGNDDEDKELKELAEKNPAVAKMLAEQEETRNAVKRLEAANRLSEVTTQLNEIGLTEKKGLPPAAKDKFRNVMARLPKNLSEDVYAALVDLMKVGMVDLSEKGGTPPPSDGGDGGDPVADFMDKVDAKLSENDKLTYRDAVDMVALEEPEAFAKYNEAIEDGTYELTE